MARVGAYGLVAVGDGRHGPAGDESLAVVSRCVGDALVVSVSGELDMLTAPQLLPAVDRCLTDADCRLLVVDMVDVAFLGSAGLKALLDVRDLAAERRLSVRLVANDNRTIIRPLAITGLEKVLTVCCTVDEALSEAPGDVR